MGRGRLWRSFGYAFKGIYHTWKTQRNMKIHFAAAAVVFILALGLGVAGRDLALLILAMALVMSAEMINTAIEATIDATVKEYHPLAGAAKDIAAGAVLLAAIAAAVIGLLVFYPYFIGDIPPGNK